MTTNKLPSSEEVEKLTQEIIEWMDTQNFPPRQHNRMAKKFLMGCKYRDEVAKKKITNYFNFRKNMEQWFDGRDPLNPIAQDLLNVGLLVISPQTTADGIPVMISRPMYLNARTYTLDVLFKVTLMLTDYFLDRNDLVVDKGLHVVLDCHGCFGYITQITPRYLWQTVQLWQYVYPLKIKSIHLYNCPFYVTYLVALLKSFMSAKLRKRLHAHGTNKEALLKYFSPEVLPDEYGGTFGPIQTLSDEVKKEIEECRDRILGKELFSGC